jgi:hypothetical protein
VVQYLLEQGADSNHSSSVAVDGCVIHVSPLEIAVLGGHLEAAKLLMKFGADLDKRDFEGSTLLEAAQLRGGSGGGGSREELIAQAIRDEHQRRSLATVATAAAAAADEL